MKKALVLSGGGSLGIYEMGAWKFFREKGITFDIVTGTSIGAINGGVYVTNAYDEAMHLWNTIQASDIYEHGFSFDDGPFQTLKKQISSGEVYRLFKSYASQRGVNIAPFKELVKQAIDPQKVKDSPITFGVVVTLYKGMKEVDIVLQEQPVELILDYIHASSAIFPIFPISKIGNVKYIDGGYNNNTPVDFAFKLGADEVTAVVLNAIMKDPQFPHLLTLPNVKYIRASHDTGFIMDFRRDVLDRNLQMGYLDTRKAYDDAWGFEYTFDKDELTEGIAKEIYLKILRTTPREFDVYRQELSYGKKKPSEILHYYIRALESMASWLQIDYLRSYGVQELEAIIIQKLRENSSDTEFIKKLLELKSHPQFGRVDKLDLLTLIYRSAKKGVYSPSLLKIIEDRKSLRFVVEMFNYWKEKGRLVD